MSQECISLTPVARRRIYSARYSLTPSTGAAFGTTRMRPVSATVPQILNVFPNNERGAEVVEFKRVTTTWRQRILRGDELICSQELRAALIDERGRPVRFDDEMVEALSRYAISD